MLKKLKTNYTSRVFALFFAFSSILLMIINLLLFFSFSGIYRSTILSQGKLQAENISNALDTTITDYEAVISNLLQDEVVQHYLQGDTSEETELEVLKKLYFVRNSFSRKLDVSILEIEHDSWVSSFNTSKLPSASACLNWGVFRKANQTTQMAVHTFSKDAVLKDSDRLCLAQAFRNEHNQVLGYVLIEVTRDALEALVSEYDSTYNTKLMIISETGSIIYHSDGKNCEGIGKYKEYGDFQELEQIKENEKIWGSYVGSYNSLTKTCILKELPTTMTSGIISILVQTMIICLITILIFSVFFSKNAANTVAYPIRELEEKMSKMAHGDLHTRVTVTRQDEIGHLGESFNTMADKIEDLITHIDEEKHSLWIAETRSLNLQMNPHFLYNTLDLIKWNAKLGRTEEVSDIAVTLGKLLRKVMSTKDDLVSVTYEMDIVNSFVLLQKKRHGGRLQLIVDIPSALYSYRLPKLTLEPIVENAIVHAFQLKSENCIVHVTIDKMDPYLILTVEDNGDGMTPEEVQTALEFRQTNTHHIGLSNVQRRAQLYGDDTCGLTIYSKIGEGTKVVLKLAQMGEVHD